MPKPNKATETPNPYAKAYSNTAERRAVKLPKDKAKSPEKQSKTTPIATSPSAPTFFISPPVPKCSPPAAVPAAASSPTSLVVSPPMLIVAKLPRCEDCGMTFSEGYLIENHNCPNADGSKLKMAYKKPEEHFTDDDAILNAIKEMSEKEIQDTGTKYQAATTYTSAHAVRRENTQQMLIDTCTLHKRELKTLVELVPDTIVPGRLVPKVFFVLSGSPPSHEQRMLCGILIFSAVHDKKNSRAKEGECPWLEPSTIMTYIRSIFAIMRDDYGWDYSLEKDFNMTGGLKARLELLFLERTKDWPSYGTCKNKQIPNSRSTAYIDLSCFDESNIKDHQQKCMLIFGGFLAFRGAKEHAELLIVQVKFGHFEAGHPLGGQMCVSVEDLLDKSHKLSTSNVYKRETKHALRLPVDPEDPTSVGGTLFRYKEKCAPGQKRWFCMPITTHQKNSFAKMGFPKAELSPNRPMGINKIQVLVKEACKRVGLDCTGQGLRRLALTTVANTQGISEEERLRFGRHNSMSAQREYQMLGCDSEMAKFKAMGLLPGKSEEE